MEEIETLTKTIKDLQQKIKDLESELAKYKPVTKTLYEKG